MKIVLKKIGCSLMDRMQIRKCEPRTTPIDERHKDAAKRIVPPSYRDYCYTSGNVIEFIAKSTAKIKFHFSTMGMIEVSKYDAMGNMKSITVYSVQGE